MHTNEIPAALAAAADHVTIEIDSGTITVTPTEAYEIFLDLAPGEAFRIVTDRSDPLPSHADDTCGCTNPYCQA